MPRIDFADTLEANLERLGIEVSTLENSMGLKQWKLKGTILGNFDAHEGWSILKHYDKTPIWHIAIHNGIGEFYDRS